MPSVLTLHESCLQVCHIYLTSSLSTSNIWVFRRHLKVPWCLNYRSIQFIIDTFVYDNFIDISQTDEILTLDEEEMRWLLDSEDMIACEGTMLQCLIRWFKYQEDERKEVFRDLFSKIALSMIPKRYLWKVIKKYKLMKIMPELKNYRTIKPFKLSINESLYKQNLSNMALVGFSKTDSLVHMQWFHLVECWMPIVSRKATTELKNLKDWKTHSRDELYCSYFVPFRDCIYVFGFCMRHNLLGIEIRCIEQLCAPVTLNLKLNSKQVSHCSVPQFTLNDHADVISCGMYIFFLGGFGKKSLQRVSRYDTLKDLWEEAEPMIYAHAVSIAVACDNRYIFACCRNYFEKYDIYTNVWSPIQSPSHIKYFWSAGHAVDNKVYIFGSQNYNQTTCFVYDLVDETWQTLQADFPRLSAINRFLGKAFCLFCGKRFEKRFSELNLESGVEERRFCCMKTSRSYTHLMLLSRGARMRMEHIKNGNHVYI